MTRRDWTLPGVLFAVAAALFGLAWWLGQLEDRIEAEVGS